MRKYNKYILGVSLLLVLGGCASKQPTYSSKYFENSKPIISSEISSAFESLDNSNEVIVSLKNGIKLLKDGDFAAANDSFEEGLRLNPTNGHLHFFNALAYHMGSKNVDMRMLDLAKTGYQTALRFDNTNYWAAYLIGQIYFDRKEYLNAQNQFSYATNYAPNNASILRALATASYYVNDMAMNSWAAEKAYKLDPNNPESIRTLMFSQAATGKIKKANEHLKQYKGMIYKSSGKKDDYIKSLSYKTVSNRIGNWNNYHVVAQNENSGDVFGGGSNSSNGLLNLDGIKDDNYQPDITGNSSSVPVSKPLPPTPTKTNNTAPVSQKVSTTTTKPKVVLPNMTLVDVVIIRTEESRSQAKGINLLDGLKATLSGTLIAWNKITGDNATESTTISPTLTLTGLEYNFNIFNDGVNKAEVLARPSLLALENQPSKFYSGSVLHVQLSSNNADGSMVDVPIGISLNVTPKFYDKNTVSITVHAERSFLETVSTDVGFTTFSQSTKTSVDATAVLNFGETLILSGLSENEKSKTKSGVPLLQDVPGVQYLFSRDEEAEYKKSILILLTPRKARYTNRNLTADEIQKELEENKEKDSKFVKELKTKHKSISNIDAVTEHLSSNEYYRQFRSGDLELDHWYFVIGRSMERALGFLYY